MGKTVSLSVNKTIAAMDKEKLWTLCEILADLEHHINDLGLKLQRLSSQLMDVKNDIIEVIKEEQKSSGQVKMIITEVYGNVESPDDIKVVQSKEINSDPDYNTENISVSSEEAETIADPEIGSLDSDVDVPKGVPVEIRYCSMALSNNFEFSDTEFIRSARSLYVIEVMNDTEARFYPIADKAKQLLMRRAELVDPICITCRDLDLGDFCITEDNYGLLKLNTYGRWDIVKKCSLIKN